MQRRNKFIGGGVLAVGLIGAGTGMALAGSSGEGEEGDDGGPLSGSTRDRAVAAALEATGGGTVSEAEYADDGGTYSVEIEVDEDGQVEVKLDDNFQVIDQGADDDGASDNDDANGED
jgi:hypothetical protein